MATKVHSMTENGVAKKRAVSNDTRMTKCVVLIALLVAGCSPAETKTPVVVLLEEPGGEYVGKLIECFEADAEMFLDIGVYIEDNFWPWCFEIPVRRAKFGDSPERMGYSCTAGTGGGRSGYIQIVPAEGDSVPLQVCLLSSWTDMRTFQDRDGQIDEVIETVAGTDGYKTFPNGWTFDWRWRDVTRVVGKSEVEGQGEVGGGEAVDQAGR